MSDKPADAAATTDAPAATNAPAEVSRDTGSALSGVDYTKDNATVVGGEDTAKGGEDTAAADTGEGGEALTGAPEAYSDFTLPEGFKVADEAVMTEFTGLFKELNLSQAGAQKLIDAQIKREQASTQGVEQQWADQKAEWLTKSKADPKIGGAHFEKSVEHSKRALQQFGDAELSEVVETFGLGNHPAFIRFASSVGEALGEDSLVPGSKTTGAEKTLAQRIYTSHK